jgi:hypothetical protein
MALPECVRSALNVHWKREHLGAGPSPPFLKLSNHPAGPARKNVLAATDSVRFWFHPEVVRTAGDEVLNTLIVHEIGHAYFQALKKPFPSDEAEEALIPTLSLAWGFEDQEIDFWMADVNASPDLSAEASF